MARPLRTLFTLFICWAAAVICPSTSRAQNDSADLAYYDAKLATVSPGQQTLAIGDMIVPVERVKRWRDMLAGKTGGGVTTASSSGPGTVLWPGGVVAYAFNANVTAINRTHFRDACAEWAMFANLTFVERTNEANYIDVRDDPAIAGGFSAVGMIGGAQPLHIGSDAWNRVTLLHEIGHAIGLIHEHQRSDRDTYVTVISQNVPPGDGNFPKIPDSINRGPYDFLSVMHYARFQSSVNPGQDTLQPTPEYASFIDLMGTFPLDRYLSRGDREGVAAMYGAGPALSLTVTNTKDSGPGSLRAALYAALDLATDSPESNPVVNFEIPITDPGFSGGVFTIRPTSRWIGVGPRTTVDATTQTAFSGNTNLSGPEVMIDGTSTVGVNNFGIGFRLVENGSTVRGFVLSGFTGRGVLISGSGNAVEGCHIGTNAAGNAALPNYIGVSIDDGAQSNRIGGETPESRCVIAGNQTQGLTIEKAGTSGNFVQGNYIGVNAAGSAALPNEFSGILIWSGASNNLIGGTDPAHRNVISGGSDQGILIHGAGTSGNTIQGNWIGLNSTGAAALPNGFAGIEITAGASGNTIGGTAEGARNVISGNAAQGVLITQAETSGNVVQGNYIGVAASGAAAVPNGFAGIAITNGATNNTIGGAEAGARNVISANGAQGVVVRHAGSTGNIVQGNLIGLNAAGTGAIGNSFAGVQVFGGATGNLIGGTAPGEGNVISGNLSQGIFFSDAGTSDNVVLGNSIGLNAAGTAAVGNAFAGVEIATSASGNVIGGTAVGSRNVISGNAAQGVSITQAGTSGNVVQGNFIGTNPAGTAALPNGFAGVAITNGATGNLVGGTEAAASNVISGNNSQGVVVRHAGTSGNRVQGNFIGTNASGTAAIGNKFSGVQVFGGAANNVIGGGALGARNVISGNVLQGVVINDAGTAGNVVAGNYIGTNAAGMAAVPNAQVGVDIFGGATGNTVGGAEPGAGNVISGNSLRAVALSGAATANNTVAGNLIGLNAAGSALLPNNGAGIAIFSGSNGNLIGGASGGRNFICGSAGLGISISGAGTNANLVQGNSIGVSPFGTLFGNDQGAAGAGVQIFNGAQLNVIGGTTPGSANLIAGHGLGGVEIFDTATRNAVLGNSIRANGRIAIDLAGGTQTSRVTANDAGDADTGPNGLQNFPVLTSAVLGAGTAVEGSLNSAANTGYRIEFYASASPDPTGFGEAENFIGATSVTTNGSGNATFSVVLPACVPAGQHISATATDANGSTSELSQNIVVTTTDSDGDGLPDVYESAHGLNVAIADAALDDDGDGQSNAAEFRAGTDPENPASAFHLGSISRSGNNIQLSLPTELGRTYRIERKDGLSAPAVWQSFVDQVLGTGAPIPFTDPGAAALPQRFYRAVVLP